MTTTPDKFLKDLKKIRNKQGYSLSQMAELLGMKFPEQYLRIEQGVHTPKTKTLEKIAKALGYTLEVNDVKRI